MKRSLSAAAVVLFSAVLLSACGGGGGGAVGLPPAATSTYTVALPKTGQTACYDFSGAVVSCATTTLPGQDGALQKGVAWPNPRFTVASSGTGTVVTDNLTGLMWQQDGSTPTVGLCTGGTKTWQPALDYVTCLNTNNYLGYNDWRLPNIDELLSLANYGQLLNLTAWLNSQGFAKTQYSYYWSSTTAAFLTSAAWYVYFSDSNMDRAPKSASTFYVRCVRGQSGLSGNSIISLPQTGQTTSYAAGDDGAKQAGVSWPSLRFAVSSSGTGTVVTDNLTGLMWQQDGSTPTVGLCTGGTGTTWQGALNYVACLNTNNYLGYKDWRLPNINELRSLVNYGQSNSAAWLDSQGFAKTQMYNWSSTTTPNASWFVALAGGAMGTANNNNYYVRCVRGGQ